ncbi:retrovirus-related pol polyprotein from transposon TNT 1-94 [Tanacetum coccineum]
MLSQLHPWIHQIHWTDPGYGRSHIILNGNFSPVARNKETQVLETVPFEQQDDDLKKKLAKNNEAKMVLYNALPKKKYERIFMCKTAKDIWQSFLITHQGNSQVKNNKIDLLVQKYQQFTILEEESIDSSFARFNTIINSLKAFDEALDELIGNLKVHEVVMEIIKSIALKAKKESSDDETLTSGSDDEEYAMSVRNFKKFFRRKGTDSWFGNMRNEVQFGAYCDAQGITHNFSAPRTPQSNGVVERKNRTLQEMSRTMLNEQSIPQKFWCNAVDTSTYILNRILIRPILGKTPYEIFRGRKPSLEYFKVFGSKCFILNTKDYLTKFDPKSYEGVFLRYSQNSKAYVVLNKHTMKVEESLNVTFNESPHPTKLSPLVDDDVGEKETIKKNTKVINNNNKEDESIEVDEIVNIKNHPLDQVIGNINQRTLRSQAQNHSNFFCFISTIEPKDVKEALKDES